MQDVSKDRTDYKVSKVSKTVKIVWIFVASLPKIPFTVQKALKNKVIQADRMTAHISQQMQSRLALCIQMLTTISNKIAAQCLAENRQNLAEIYILTQDTRQQITRRSPAIIYTVRQRICVMSANWLFWRLSVKKTEQKAGYSTGCCNYATSHYLLLLYWYLAAKKLNILIADRHL